MGCDCYRIGGPFIAEDPDCPIHGHEAQRRERIDQEGRNRGEDRLSDLEHRVAMIDINLYATTLKTEAKMKTRKMHPDWVAKTTIRELVDGIVGNAGPRPPEGFREDVEDALARAIEIGVSSRHPTVVRWRNDGIEVCAGIADLYDMKFAAQDMRALKTKE